MTDKTDNWTFICYSRQKMRMVFILLGLAFCVASCNTQANQHPHEMPEFLQINAPTRHYATLQQLPDDPQSEFKGMDSIYFPDKANQLLMMSIQSAYLSKQEIKDIVPTMSHPANSSKQVRAELNFLLDVQKNRSQKEMDEALRIHDIVYFPIVGMKSDAHLFFEAYEIFGSDFDPKQYPKTKQLLHNIMKDMRIMEFAAKNQILRPRPRQLETRLTPLKKMKSSSFASGHTLWAYLQGYIFASLVPTNGKEFLDLAFKIGYTREILGVHYPSDEEAARVLAHRMLTRMWEIDSFKKDFLSAQSEWKQ